MSVHIKAGAIQDHQNEAAGCHHYGLPEINTMDTLLVVLVIILIAGLVIWDLSIRFRIIKLIVKVCRTKSIRSLFR